jgi:hypothetical protein
VSFHIQVIGRVRLISPSLGSSPISVRWYFIDLDLIARPNAADVTHDVCGQQADVELGFAAYAYCGAAHTEEYPAAPVS